MQKIFNFFSVKKGQTVTYRDLMLEALSYSNNIGIDKNAYKNNVIVYRAIKLISEQGSLIEYELYQGDREIERHPLLDLLNKPYPTLNKTSFLLKLFSHYNIYGNAYIMHKYVDQQANYIPTPPILLYPLLPTNITWQEGYNFMIDYYQYQDGKQSHRFNVSDYGLSNLTHIKNNNPYSDFDGLSPLSPAKNSINHFSTAEIWNNSLLKNGAKPSGILSYDTPLNEQAIARLREELAAVYAGSENAGRPMVIDKGGKWTQSGLSPVDMDFINAEKATIHKIALANNVSMELMNTEQSKYDNLSAAYEQLWSEAVQPMVDNYINELNSSLVPKFSKDLKLKYDESKVLASQTKRLREMRTYNTFNYITQNEKREQAGYEPIEGQDIFVSTTTRDTTQDPQTDQLKADFISREIKEDVPLSEAKKIADIIYGS